MAHWFKIENPSNDIGAFSLKVNTLIFSSPRIKGYWKLFRPKAKELNGRIFYLAIEKDEDIQIFKKKFTLIECTSALVRKDLARVGGFTADRPWMFLT